MIKLSIVNHEASYNAEIFPPLLELGDWEFKGSCIRDFSTKFDLGMRDILLPRKDDQSYQIYFKKTYLNKPETFSVNIGFDSITTRSENFESVENMVQNHFSVLNSVFGKIDFSPKAQTVSYAANTSILEGKTDEYLDSLVIPPSELFGVIKAKGAYYSFDGPIAESVAQIMVGDSIGVPGGLYLSIQFFFSGDFKDYKELFRRCADYTRNKILPKFDIVIEEKEPGAQ